MSEEPTSDGTSRRRLRRKRDDSEIEARQRLRTYQKPPEPLPRDEKPTRTPRKLRPVRPVDEGPVRTCGGWQGPQRPVCGEEVPRGKVVCNACAYRAFEDLWRSDIFLRNRIVERIAVAEIEAKEREAAAIRQRKQHEAAEVRRRELAEQREREAVHVVYYLRTAPGRVKIGTTGDLARRLSEYRSDPTYLLALEPGGYDLEQQRHAELRKWRVDRRREDYAEGPEVLARIAAVVAEHGDPVAYAQLTARAT